MLKKYLLMLNVALILVALAIVVNLSLSLARSRELPLSPPSPSLLVEEEIREEPKPYDYYSVIIEKTLFGSSPASEASEEIAQVIEALPQHLSNLKLKGTIVAKGVASLCIIENSANGKEEVYRTGDFIAESEIVKIERNHIMLKTTSGLAPLTIYEKGGKLPLKVFSKDRVRAKKIAHNRWAFTKDEASEIMRNPSQLLTQTKVTRHFEADQMVGFELSNIEKGSTIGELGIRDGDIIKKVDGHALNSVGEAIKIYNEVKNKSMIKIEVERNGSPITLTYEVK